MERVVSLTSFEEQAARNDWLEYWLTRPPEERLAEVERLRREYASIRGARSTMEIHKDFADLCSLLNASHVEYLIVGGYAVAFHGVPRSTGGFDFLIRPTRENVERALAAVEEVGFPANEVTAQDVLAQRKILQLGRIPMQIHLMISISGLTWDSAWESKAPGSYGGVPVFFIGRDALLANKKAAGRTKDLADVEALQRPPVAG